jgi:hypothetical protein
MSHVDKVLHLGDDINTDDMGFWQKKKQGFMQPIAILKDAVAIQQAKIIWLPQERWLSQPLSGKLLTILIKH